MSGRKTGGRVTGLGAVTPKGHRTARNAKQHFADGLKTQPKQREVVCDGLEFPIFASVYTMQEAATALGITRPTLTRYIQHGLFPQPILRDTSHGYSQYSEGELRCICRCLADHAKAHATLTTTHQHTIHRIWQSVEAFRKSHV